MTVNHENDSHQEGDEGQAVKRAADDATLQLAAEELSVSKETVETGRLRVATRTREREAVIDENLAREHVEIETVPIGLRIDAMPKTRQEGDTTIIPIVEEKLVVERRLVLKEEVRIKRVRTTESHKETVMLRYQEAVVTRHPSDTVSTDAGSVLTSGQANPERESCDRRRSKGESHMAYETVVAVFDTRAHADAAVKALKAGGFANADISIFDNERLAGGQKAVAAGVKEAGLWQRLFGDDVYEHEAAVYHDAVKGGGVVVSARVMDSEVAHAVAILDLHRPVDVHDRAVTSGIAPAAHIEAIEKKIDAVPLAAGQKVAVTPKLAEVHDGILRLAEEQLQVGKRAVETGRTRIRRYVTERDASADVTLHDEHAEVMRRAITDPKYVGEIDWADSEIEAVETAEHALASKTARIVEEVSLKKVGADRVETVKDKLRRQQVEVQRVGPDGKVIPNPKPGT
jgi:uncharacterized protein (TIGR02271 family)